jgi:hypothetical protein
MTKARYELPVFLTGVVAPEKYRRWLQRKAAAHVRRDRKRRRGTPSISRYKQAIHAAVLASAGRDAYTGLLLDWSLIGRYTNATSKAGRVRYKHRFADLPTVDHDGGSASTPLFRICSWRTNDAKHDLPYVDFVRLCRVVLKHAARRRHRS